jgi:hypothetical protein
MLRKRSRKKPGSARRKPSSRRSPRYEDPVDRIHRVRRELEAEKRRLGLSEREWLTYIREKNAEFEAKVRSGLKRAK